MDLHANAKLGLSGRYQLVLAIEAGLSLRAAAAAFSVSPATAHRWSRRWRQQRSKAVLCDRSSRPRHCPRQLTPAEEEPILRARRETGLGPAQLVRIVHRARSTIWKVLWRHGLSRQARQPRPRYRSYEWSRAGAAARGHQEAAPLSRARASLDWRPPSPLTLDRLPLPALRPRRQLPFRARRAAPARGRRDLRPRTRASTHRARRSRTRPTGGGDDRQRLRLHQGPPLPRDPHQDRSTPHRHPALHAPLEREGRTLHPDPAPRMGLRTPMPDLQRPRPRPAKLPPLLQPATTAQQPRRATPHQPRSQRLWVRHLDRRPCPVSEIGRPRSSGHLRVLSSKRRLPPTSRDV